MLLNTIKIVSLFSTIQFALIFFFHAMVFADLAASRTIGVAPLGVHFSAGVAGSTLENRPFHDLDYAWDFGDSTKKLWPVSNKSKNAALGPVAAHVFENPGTYTVTLTTSDAGGQISQETIQITVEDPDSVYSGTQTICISNTLNNTFAGCPDEAQHITTDNVSDIKDAVTSGRRILLHRGSSWSSDGQSGDETHIGNSIAGPVTFGAYGECINPDVRGICENAPHFELNYPIPYGEPGYGYPSLFSMSRSSDWRIMDISFAGNDNFNAAIGGATDIGPLLVSRIKTVGFRVAITTTLYQSTGHDQFMLVSSDLSDAVSTVIYVGSENMALLGNSIRDARSSHVVRIWQAHSAVIGHNTISGSSLENDSGRHALKLHGLEESILIDLYGTRKRTQFVIVGDNIFGGCGPWPVGIGPQNALKDERLRDIIVENNRFFSDYGNLSSRLVSVSLVIWARDVSVRNNIFDGNGSGDTYAAIAVEQRGVEPAPSGMLIANNTIYKTDVDTTPGVWNLYAGVQVADMADEINTFNNLAVFPEDSQGESIVMVRNMDGSGVLQDKNLLLQGTYSGLLRPDDSNHLNRKYHLLCDSPGINQGATISLFRDYSGATRPEQGLFDVGAYEYFPAPPLKLSLFMSALLSGMEYRKVLMKK